MLSFPRSKRLLTAKHFQEVFKSAKRFYGKKFIFFVKQNKLGHPRIGFAVSKKSVAKSVERSRIKRIFRESFRKQTNLPPIDIVIVAQKGLSEVTNQQLFADIETQWQKLIDYYKSS